jgi:hypothetical protein
VKRRPAGHLQGDGADRLLAGVGRRDKDSGGGENRQREGELRDALHASPLPGSTVT